MKNATTPRNALCPCGSGDKYKNCCRERDVKRRATAKSRKLLISVAAVAVAMVMVIGLALIAASRPGPYDALAKCLTQKGYTMYGSRDCPHCKEQKAFFDKSFKRVNYVECAAPDGSGVNELCRIKDIKDLPTWITPKGKKLVGVHSLGELADESSCPLPGKSS